MTPLFGGAFDPPHAGHVAFLRAAAAHFGFERARVLVVAVPGHKHVAAGAGVRLHLAALAFPGHDVELDFHARTVDSLEAGGWPDPLFLVGADELAGFLEWKQPERVLELARLGVGTRPGYPRERLDAVLERLARPDRVELFDLEPVAVSSTEVRARVARGEPIDGLVPPPVAEEIRRLGLYRSGN